MANAVPEPTLSRRRLDLNKSTNCRLWIQFLSARLLNRLVLNHLQTAVWRIVLPFEWFLTFARGSSACRDLLSEVLTVKSRQDRRISDIGSLSTLLLKTEMLAEELQHMILKTISNLARVSSLVLFKAVRDSVPIKHVMQFGCIAS